MSRVVATAGVSVTELELRLNLEGKSIDGQVETMLNMFRIKFAQIGRVIDSADFEKPGVM